MDDQLTRKESYGGFLQNDVLSNTRNANKEPSLSDSSSLVSGGRSLVWSRTSACHADDPGSNLGDRTISLSLLVKREPELRENTLFC